MRLRLYHYWRSSSSWRVRWAMALKGLCYEPIAVNLLSDEPESEVHRARNPLGFVPVLELLDAPEGDPARFLAESVAILEWVEEATPHPPLLPSHGRPLDRAHVRQLCQLVNAGIQPLQNLNTMHFFSADPAEQKRWSRHWIRQGLQAYERLAMRSAGRFSFGDQVTMADLFLIPQCYNASRFEVSLDDYPTIGRIAENALATEACQASHPDSFRPATPTS